MSRTSWPRQRWIDLVFIIGIGFKAVDGAAEVLLAVPLLLFSPHQLISFAQLVTAGELSEDPNGLVSHGLLRMSEALNASDATTFATVYLLVHGVVKLAIVVALFIGSRRVYPFAVAALTVFLGWQAFELVVHPTPVMALLTVFDLLVLLLTWREWRHHRSLHDAVRSVFRGPDALPREHHRRQKV